MKLLVDARPIVDPNQGGVSRVALELIAAYAERSPDDQIICVTTGAKRPTLPQRLIERSNIAHCHLAIPNKIWSMACLVGLVSLINATERRVGKLDAAFFPNLGFIGHVGPTLPTALLLHDLSFLIEPKWFSWKQRLWHRAINAKKIIREMPMLFSVSETTKRDAVRLLGILPEKITVIPIGSTLHSVIPALAGIRPTGRFVLALGGNDPRKNSATAIETVKKLQHEEKFHDLELVLVGGKNRPSDDELASLYTNAAAFLYPSWYEGYGLPLHEAAAFGTPCIASMTGALPETAPHGTFFANPAKPQHWTEALREVLTTERPLASDADSNSWPSAAALLRKKLTP